MSENVTPIKGNQDGLPNDKINHVINTINEAIASAKDFTDSSNETVKAFGEDGGDKSAIRFVAKLKRMEPAKAQAFLRSIDHYAHAAGIFDQMDFFEEPLAAE